MIPWIESATVNCLNLRSGTGSTSMRWGLILIPAPLSSIPLRSQHSITTLENPKGLFDLKLLCVHICIVALYCMQVCCLADSYSQVA